ncbi:MAG: flavin reductase family protein [Stomatobaculum sp.]|nr:flavin reductase family protein [Stomatobaculum sp.]
MAKEIWRPGNMLYPVPAVMVSCAGKEGRTDIITVAWTGTVCSSPPMVSISIRPERFSYHMIRETGEFVINLTTEKLVRAADLCGVKSGRDTDKWKLAGLTPEKASRVAAPMIAESPVNIECRVTEVLPLGSHHMFLGEVAAVQVDASLLDENGRLDLQKAAPAVYSHGEYYGLGKLVGTFGYSVRKPAKKPGKRKK